MGRSDGWLCTVIMIADDWEARCRRSRDARA